jgi:hypothetical protein
MNNAIIKKIYFLSKPCTDFFMFGITLITITLVQLNLIHLSLFSALFLLFGVQKEMGKNSMPWPGFEPGLSRPQREVLTTIRSRLDEGRPNISHTQRSLRFASRATFTYFAYSSTLRTRSLHNNPIQHHHHHMNYDEHAILARKPTNNKNNKTWSIFFFKMPLFYYCCKKWDLRWNELI